MTVSLADLPPGQLGAAAGAAITVDVDAAGRGWFVDPTPEDAHEFATLLGTTLTATEGPAAGRVDLHTVLLHEIGHVLGFDHDATLAVMAEALAAGQRVSLPDAVTLPLADPVAGALITRTGDVLTDSPVSPAPVYYTVDETGTVRAFSDAGLSVAIFGPATGVTRIIANASGTSVLVGPTNLFDADPLDGVAPEVVWTLTGDSTGTLGFATATGSVSIIFENISDLRGGTDITASSHRLIGLDEDSVWTLTGPNAGTLVSDSVTISFTDIDVIQGGSAADAVVFTEGGLVTGGIDNSAGGLFEVTVGDFLTVGFAEGSASPLTVNSYDDVDGVTAWNTVTGSEVMLDDLEYLEFTLTGGSVFAGTGAAGYFSQTARGETPAAAGVVATAVDFSLRVYRQAFSAGWHVWSAAQGTIGSLALVGADGVRASVTNAEVSVLTETAGAVIGGVEVTQGVVLRDTVPDATAEVAQVSGRISLAVGGTAQDPVDQVLVAGQVTVTRSAASDVVTAAGPVDGAALSLGFTDAVVFAGTGAVLPDLSDIATPVAIDMSNATGFIATGLNARLAVFTATDPLAPVYVGLTFTTAAEALGIPDVRIVASELTVNVNLASDGTAALDWTQAALLDPAGEVLLDLTLDGVQITAAVLVSVAGAVSVAGRVDLAVTTQDIDDGAIQLAGASVFRLSLTEGYLFAGTSPEFVVDAAGYLVADGFQRDTDGVITGAPPAAWALPLTMWASRWW